MNSESALDTRPDRYQVTAYSWLDTLEAVAKATTNGYILLKETNEDYPQQYGTVYIMNFGLAPDVLAQKAEAAAKAEAELEAQKKEKKLAKAAKLTPPPDFT